MCTSFAKAVRDTIPLAEIITDRFHIIKKVNENLWDLNKKTFKKLDEKKRNRFSNIRYLLVKDYRELNKYDKRLIKDYLRLNTEIKEMYLLIQDFRKILFDYKGYKHGFVSEKLGEWATKSKKCLKNFVETLETWWNEVINACIFKENNGIQEGINNKIKLVKRRGFGYRNWLNFEFRIKGECNP